MILYSIIAVSALFSGILIGYLLNKYRQKAQNLSEEQELSVVREALSACQAQDAEQEKAMIKNVLDFADIQVYDVMNHRKNLFSLDITMPVKDILQKVKNCPFSRIPLYRDKPENIVGVIRVKTLFREAIDKKGKYEDINIEDIMTAPWFIPDNTTLIKQLQMFRARREHFAIVVDEYGDLQGIVTLEDILEEIVGDINDESDIPNLDTMGIRKLDENSWLVDGQVPIRDLNRKYGWTINDENAVTIAGYLLDMTQSIPEQHQKFIFEGFQFEVMKRQRNQISQIKMTKISSQH